MKRALYWLANTLAVAAIVFLIVVSLQAKGDPGRAVSDAVRAIVEAVTP